MLYRLFPFDPDAQPTYEGGPFFVPRAFQGDGRHDNPDDYGVMYASKSLVSVVAERLQRFRDRPITDALLRWERGLPYAVVRIDDGRLSPLVDLDDPRILAERELRPSRVATEERETTQTIARSIHAEGHEGFEWWSTIEASWINVTLFAERALSKLSVAADPEPLSVTHPAVQEAADAVGVRLAAG